MAFYLIGLVTVGTRERLFICVNLYVSVQIGDIGEAFSAVRTLVGLIVRVSSQFSLFHY